MLCLNIFISGNITDTIQKKLEKILQDEKNIYGWCKFSKYKIVICLEGENINSALYKIQEIVLKSKNISININTENINNYQNFNFIEKSIISEIEKSKYIDYLFSLTKTADKYFKFIMAEFENNAKSIKNMHSYENCDSIFKILPSRYIPENLVIKQDFSSKYLAYTPSFSSQMTEHTLFRKVFSSQKKYVIEDIINNKVKAINFAHALNIPVPKIYQKNILKHEINFDLKNVVLKPMDGHTSKNVYIIHDNFIHSVEKREKIDFETLKIEIAHSPYKNWMVEQYITGYDDTLIPYDIKLFCFYGIVKLILIIDRNNEKLRHEWLDENFNRVDTGRFNESLFKSNFNNIKAIDFAKQISLNIPTPFLRIDFLASENEIYFGEITPRPGHFHEFNADTDSKLGNSFIAARTRLTIDFIEDKKFEQFKKLIS